MAGVRSDRHEGDTADPVSSQPLICQVPTMSLWRESNTVKTCEDDVRAHGPGGWWSRELGVNLEARSVDATEVECQSVNPMGKAIEAFVRARLGRTEPAGTREEAPRG